MQINNKILNLPILHNKKSNWFLLYNIQYLYDCNEIVRKNFVNILLFHKNIKFILMIFSTLIQFNERNLNL